MCSLLWTASSQMWSPLWTVFPWVSADKVLSRSCNGLVYNEIILRNTSRSVSLTGKWLEQMAGKEATMYPGSVSCYHLHTLLCPADTLTTSGTHSGKTASETWLFLHLGTRKECRFAWFYCEGGISTRKSLASRQYCLRSCGTLGTLAFLCISWWWE